MSEAAPRVVPLGEAAWTVVLGGTVDRAIHRRVMALAARIQSAEIKGVVELVPAYAALTVRYDPLTVPGHELRARLVELAAPEPGGAEPSNSAGPDAAVLHTIPVRYDGPDLAEVSRITGLAPESVVRMHSEREYLVYMLGFAPGWAYLGDLHPALVIPRRASPRIRVPAGAVAIAGGQTGVYPLATPGGWHLIGSTGLRLFDPERNPPALLAPGDRVRFEPLG